MSDRSKIVLSHIVVFRCDDGRDAPVPFPRLRLEVLGLYRPRDLLAATRTWNLEMYYHVRRLVHI